MPKIIKWKSFPNDFLKKYCLLKSKFHSILNLLKKKILYYQIVFNEVCLAPFMSLIV
jgi:hypothetical protein